MRIRFAFCGMVFALILGGCGMAQMTEKPSEACGKLKGENDADRNATYARPMNAKFEQLRKSAMLSVVRRVQATGNDRRLDKQFYDEEARVVDICAKSEGRARCEQAKADIAAFKARSRERHQRLTAMKCPGTFQGVQLCIPPTCPSATVPASMLKQL